MSLAVAGKSVSIAIEVPRVAPLTVPFAEEQPRVAEAVQLAIEDGYDDFVTRVAEARGQTWEEVDRIARGRVWTGEDALGLGLVDQLGDLEDAIASAAKRAELKEGFPVFLVEEEWSLSDRLLEQLLAVTGGAAPPDPGPPPPLVRALRSIEDELGRLTLWNDPAGAYVHCLCGEDWP